MKRIQRQRTKGWRMPENAVYAGRPSRWGNPYSMPGTLPGRHDGLVYEHPKMAFIVRTREESVEAYRRYIVPFMPTGWIAPLLGHDLACWCPLDQPCHADVLLELAAA